MIDLTLLREISQNHPDDDLRDKASTLVVHWKLIGHSLDQLRTGADIYLRTYVRDLFPATSVDMDPQQVVSSAADLLGLVLPAIERAERAHDTLASQLREDFERLLPQGPLEAVKAQRAKETPPGRGRDLTDPGEGLHPRDPTVKYSSFPEGIDNRVDLAHRTMFSGRESAPSAPQCVQDEIDLVWPGSKEEVFEVSEGDFRAYLDALRKTSAGADFVVSGRADTSFFEAEWGSTPLPSKPAPATQRRLFRHVCTLPSGKWEVVVFSTPHRCPEYQREIVLLQDGESIKQIPERSIDVEGPLKSLLTWARSAGPPGLHHVVAGAVAAHARGWEDSCCIRHRHIRRIRP